MVCSFQVKGKSLSQVEEFKYSPRVMFTSDDGKRDQEIWAVKQSS